MVLAVLTLLLFREYLLSGPGSMLMGQDTIAAGIMFRKFFVEHIRALGRLPLWNPYLFGGVPTIEAGSGDILYPASILHFILPADQRPGMEADPPRVSRGGLHVSRGPGIRRQPPGSALCRVRVHAVGEPCESGLGRPGREDVCHRALSRGTVASGHCPRPPFLGALYLAGCGSRADGGGAPSAGVLRLSGAGGIRPREPLGRRQAGGAFLANGLAGGMVAVVTAAGVAAVVLLPMYRYLREDSPRAGPGRGFEYSATWSLHAEEAPRCSFPSSPEPMSQSQTYWGKNPFKHNSEYGGALVFVLGIAALAGLRGDRRRWGLAAMAGIALLYALGAGTPVFRLLYSVVPGLKNFRAPSLAAYLAIVALTLLSALLIERALAAGDPRARRADVGGPRSRGGCRAAGGGDDAGHRHRLLRLWTSIFGAAEAAAGPTPLPPMSGGSRPAP